MTSSGPQAILIGPMAAGKSSTGRALARLWGVPFTDLDAEIERREGRAIPLIFAEDGEPGFRRLELAVLAELLDSGEGVLALGGGAPLTPGAAELLAGRPVVLLEIDARGVEGRLRGGKGRPMLAGADPLARWRAVTSARMPAYRELARVRLDASGRGPRALARAIDRLIRPHRTENAVAGT